MIVRRGFRIAEPPRASASPTRSVPVRERRHRMRIALRPGARAPPEPRPAPVTGAAGNTSSRHGAGPAEAPLAQANQTPPRVDYGTESVMTTQITSACSQCKRPLSRASCGIAQAGCVRQAMRRSEAYP
jgi:hypothetical protein